MKKITLILTLLFFGTILAQNTCLTAVPITAPGFFVVDAVNGTVPTTICTLNGQVTNSNPAGEWYVYTPTQDHSVTISSNIVQNTPRVDTRVHVYTGTCSNLVCLAGDDDSGSNYSSVVTFNVVAGNSYYIAWDNKWSSNGFTFQLTEGSVIVIPTAPITYSTQSLSTLGSSYNICVVDMNGDHKDDLVGVSSNNLKINYQGTTPNSFTTADFPISGTSKMPSWSMAAGDYNRDGFNDLILGSTNGLSVWSSNSSGTAYSNFSPSEYIFCQRTNFADLNNDGNLDVFSCHDIAPNCYYLNDGANNLTFYQSTVTPGAMNISNGGGNYATLFTDFDNDGDSDVFISKCSGPPCQLFRYDGNGVYTNISTFAGIDVTPIQTWSSAIADFDNDGDMDIIITASAGSHRFFKNSLDTTNNVNLTFTDKTGGSGWDTNSSTNIDNIAYDFDNDGFVDVLGGGNKIMFNQGNDTFSSVSYTGISVGAVGDLNNDGFLDINNGSLISYAVPNGNNWFKVALEGIESNSNGIGARLEIYGAFGRQIRDIRSGEGFKYMSSLNAHFGIGTNTEISKLVIKWPSGTVDEILNPSINQLLVVVEGSSPLANTTFVNSVFSISPNPTKEMLNITLKNTSTSIKAIQIVDLNGRVIMKPKTDATSIDIKSLANGTYLLVIKENDGKQTTQRFIKN